VVQQISILIHGKQSHVMSSSLIQFVFAVGFAHLVGEITSARNDQQ